MYAAAGRSSPIWCCTSCLHPDLEVLYKEGAPCTRDSSRCRENCLQEDSQADARQRLGDRLKGITECYTMSPSMATSLSCCRRPCAPHSYVAIFSVSIFGRTSTIMDKSWFYSVYVTSQRIWLDDQTSRLRRSLNRLIRIRVLGSRARGFSLIVAMWSRLR